jgi:hypothetical protein
MVEFVILGLLCFTQLGVFLWIILRDRADHATERTALLDRVQSPDLASYYGARAAWHPEEFPPEEPKTYDYDEFGYVQDVRHDSERLPGEMSPEA